jgi:hypothetical protein
VKRILPVPVAAWFLLHDNSLPHRGLSVKELVSVHQITVLSHAPYSPDLSTWIFFLFPRLKRVLKGHRHADVQAIHPLQKSSAPFQKVLSRTASKTTRNAGSRLLMQEKAISNEVPSTRV